MGYIEKEKQITKKQHYVPKAYLKNFTIDNKKSEQVYVVFNGDKKTKIVSINNICCRSYLYDQIAIDPDSRINFFAAPNEIENSFIELEGNYAAIVAKIKKDLDIRDEFKLTTKEIKILKRFISTLVFRNPIFVHTIKQILGVKYAKDPECIEWIKNRFQDISPNIVFSIIANELLKTFISPNIGLFPYAMYKTMKNSQICIFKAKATVFITSDMPVLNIWGQKDGVEYDLLGMPITPKLFLAFVDTESCIPKVVTLDDESVKRINSRQTNGNMLISVSEHIFSSIDSTIDIKKEDDEDFYEMLHIDKETVSVLYNKILNSKEIKYWR